MNEQQAKSILKSVENQFNELGWTGPDKFAAMRWYEHTILLLKVGNMPTSTPKYAEVLRAIANTIDLAYQIEKDNENLHS